MPYDLGVELNAVVRATVTGGTLVQLGAPVGAVWFPTRFISWSERETLQVPTWLARERGLVADKVRAQVAPAVVSSSRGDGMKTGSWFTTRGVAGRIGISVGTPRGMDAGFRLYRPLNPDKAWLELPRHEYEALYFDRLSKLDPQRTWDELHAMARDPSGANASPEPVLLCFEKPPFTEGNWCHRRLVAFWFEATLGKSVGEYGHNGADLQLTVEGSNALLAIRRQRA